MQTHVRGVGVDPTVGECRLTLNVGIQFGCGDRPCSRAQPGGRTTLRRWCETRECDEQRGLSLGIVPEVLACRRGLRIRHLCNPVCSSDTGGSHAARLGGGRRLAQRRTMAAVSGLRPRRRSRCRRQAPAPAHGQHRLGAGRAAAGHPGAVVDWPAVHADASAGRARLRDRFRDQRRGDHVISAAAGRAAAAPAGSRPHRWRRRSVHDSRPSGGRAVGCRCWRPTGHPRGLTDLRVFSADAASARARRTAAAHGGHGERFATRGGRGHSMGLPRVRPVHVGVLHTRLVRRTRDHGGRPRPLHPGRARPHGLSVRHHRRGRWDRCRPRRDCHHVGGSTVRHRLDHHRVPRRHDARRDRDGVRRARDGDGRHRSPSSRSGRASTVWRWGCPTPTR